MNVTFVTIINFCRTSFNVLMTPRALFMSGVFCRNDLSVFNIRFVVTIKAYAHYRLAFRRKPMTFSAGDQRGFVVGWVVVTVPARNAVT